MHNEADTVAEHEYLNNQEFFLHQNEHSLNRRVLMPECIIVFKFFQNIIQIVVDSEHLDTTIQHIY